MAKTLEKFFNNRPAMFFAGLVLSLLIGGGLQAAVTEKGTITIGATYLAYFGAAVFGILLGIEVIALLQRERNAPWSAGSMTGEILFPTVDSPDCPPSIEMNGTVSSELPPGSFLWIVRRFDKDAGFFAVAHDREPKPHGKKGRSWTIKTNVGGEKGNRRWLELWLVGPEAHAYLVELKRANDAAWAKMNAISAASMSGEAKWQMGLCLASQWMPKDAKKLASVTVRCQGGPK